MKCILSENSKKKNIFFLNDHFADEMNQMSAGCEKERKALNKLIFVLTVVELCLAACLLSLPVKVI